MEDGLNYYGICRKASAERPIHEYYNTPQPWHGHDCRWGLQCKSICQMTSTPRSRSSLRMRWGQVKGLPLDPLPLLLLPRQPLHLPGNRRQTAPRRRVGATSRRSNRCIRQKQRREDSRRRKTMCCLVGPLLWSRSFTWLHPKQN